MKTRSRATTWRRSIPITLVLATLAFTQPAGAAPINFGIRSIVDLYCYTTTAATNYCYVKVDGTAMGPTGCVSVELRWDATTTNGKEVLAILMTAQAGNRDVEIHAEDTCSAGSTYPALRRVTIKSP